MKLLCDACHRLLPPASWAVVGGALHLRCAGCGATAAVPGTAAAGGGKCETSSGTAAGSPGVSPGGAGRDPTAAGDAASGTPAAAPGAGAPEDASWLDGEWAALESRWDDPEAHRRLLSRAEARDDLAALGRRYKERLDADPGDAAALRARDELVKRATARLLVAPSRPAAAGPSGKNVLVAATFLTVLGLLVLWLIRFGGMSGAP